MSDSHGGMKPLDPRVLEDTIMLLGLHSADGLNLAHDRLRRLGIDLAFHPLLVERWRALMQDKANRALSARVKELRTAAMETLRALPELDEPWSRVADDEVRDRGRQLGLVLAHACGALAAAAEPGPEVRQVAVGVLTRALGGVGLEPLDGDLARGREPMERAHESMTWLRDALERGDAENVRTALTECRERLRETADALVR